MGDGLWGIVIGVIKGFTTSLNYRQYADRTVFGWGCRVQGGRSHGFFLGALNTRSRMIIETQQGTTTSTHIEHPPPPTGKHRDMQRNVDRKWELPHDSWLRFQGEYNPP